MARQQLSQAQSPMSVFNATKTGLQTCVITGAATVIVWGFAKEFRDETNFSVINNSWIAPADGWLISDISLSLVDGDGADDTMTYGIWVNGTKAKSITDNWRFQTNSGRDYVSNFSYALAVSAGDEVDIRYDGTAFATKINANGSSWVGRFLRS